MFPDRANAFTHAVPANAYFLIPLCLKEFSQFVQDERQRGRERKRQTDREREEERGRERLDAFSNLLHFSLAPRGFSKAFSKNTSGCVVDQTAAAATSQPTQQTVALIFQSLSVSVLCLFYTLPGK